MSLTDKEKQHYHSMSADERKVEIKARLDALYLAINAGSLDRPTAFSAIEVINELTVADEPKAEVSPKAGLFTPVVETAPIAH